MFGFVSVAWADEGAESALITAVDAYINETLANLAEGPKNAAPVCGCVVPTDNQVLADQFIFNAGGGVRIAAGNVTGVSISQASCKIDFGSCIGTCQYNIHATWSVTNPDGTVTTRTDSVTIGDGRVGDAQTGRPISYPSDTVKCSF